ncbi:copper resistance CopC/CopD family protein [Streptomyces sp. KMM 9044]|uniref:copper resistance CopC/CopD family protein n=1 Tax=Streptomyces sp. KMM 9044 TaxID=2744474 RepID=UPI002151EFFB|nr:copper resistance protein CopC [Streptomyces sp. KMM 9044]WAX79003.1 copper resistance protein CopC [Streptomyces sp. KMM 9044]
MLVLLLLGSAGPANAHAALRGADPEDGSVVRSAPRHVTLTFTESVALLDDSFRIYSPDNHRVPLGEPEHADGRSDTARAGLPDGLDDGTYTVAWRVVSADSHPVSGAFTFSIGEPSPTAAAVPAPPAEHPITASLYDTGRYLAYIAAALLIGTAAFAALCRPPDTAPLRMPLVMGWWTLSASTVVLLVLRAPYENGTSPATAFDLAAFTGVLTERPGIALLARVALLVLTAAILLRLPLPRRGHDGPDDRTPPARLAVGTVLAVALALTWASAEHASAGIQVPLAMTSSVLHLLAMACWLGGLTALLVTLFRAAAPPPVATVTRFSRLAFLSVTVLVVTGVYQSWRGLGSWSALADSSYGRTLTVKLVLAAALLSAAGLSRRLTLRLATTASAAPAAEAGADADTEKSAERATAAVRERIPELVAFATPDKPSPVAPTQPAAPTGPPADDGVPGLRPPAPDPSEVSGPDAPAHDRYHRALRVSVLVEAAVAVVVLLVTTVLTSTLPARAEAEAETAATGTAPVAGLPAATVVTIPYATDAPGGKGSVQITLDPGRVGENGIQAVAFDSAGALDSVPELRLSFTLDEKDIGPIDAGLTDRGGYWATSDLALPLPGTWTMKATIRVSEVDQVTESHSVRIEP